MCFSATASFSAGAVLTAVGVFTLRGAREPRELGVAAIPLLFAIQQFIEGFIWLTFRHEAPVLQFLLTYGYSFFSHVLWPVFIPVAVLLVEPPGWRRTALAVVATAGIAVGSSLMYTLVFSGVVARPVGEHIEYVSPHFFAGAVMSLYLLSTTVSPGLSTHRILRVFGLLALLSFATVYYFYAKWFISVWCFFAALLSAVILVHVRWASAAPLGPHTSRALPLGRRRSSDVARPD